MRPLEIHRRYFDLKVLLILIFMIITIFAATKTQAKDDLSGHKNIMMGKRSQGAVPQDNFFYEPNQIIGRGMQGILIYHPRKLKKRYMGFGSGSGSIPFRKSPVSVVPPSSVPQIPGNNR